MCLLCVRPADACQPLQRCRIKAITFLVSSPVFTWCLRACSTHNEKPAQQVPQQACRPRHAEQRDPTGSLMQQSAARDQRGLHILSDRGYSFGACYSHSCAPDVARRHAGLVTRSHDTCGNGRRDYASKMSLHALQMVELRIQLSSFSTCTVHMDGSSESGVAETV